MYRLAERFSGQIRTAGMGAAATGLDMTDALTVSVVQGVDPDLASELLSWISQGVIAAWNDTRTSRERA